eukprot:gene11009-biopygen12370
MLDWPLQNHTAPKVTRSMRTVPLASPLGAHENPSEFPDASGRAGGLCAGASPQFEKWWFRSGNWVVRARRNPQVRTRPEAITQALREPELARRQLPFASLSTSGHVAASGSHREPEQSGAAPQAPPGKMIHST